MASRRFNGSWEHGFRASGLVALCCLLACGGNDVAGAPLPSLDGGMIDASFADAIAVRPDGEVVRPEAPPAQPPVKTAARRNLYIVAHEDDDLGLMSPDLLSRVLSGEPVRTVYLTSGDAGLECDEYVRSREQGVKVAYAMMAGVDNVWEDRETRVLGKLVRVSRLRDTAIELAFLGFHNGGYTLNVTPDLEALWNGGVATVATRTLDGRSHSDSYTRSDLIAVLRQILSDWKPTHIQTLDSSRLQPLVWPFDHSDHVHSALFALSAILQYDLPHSLSMYRAYNDMFEQPNISSAAEERKKEVFQTYLKHDPKICDTGKVVLCGREADCDPTGFYTDFSRQYRTVVYENVAGLVRGPFGSCVTGDSLNESVKLAPCDRDSRAQHFKVSVDGSITHLPSGLCLDAGASTRGSVLTLARCVDRLQQRFLLTTQRQLRGPDSTCVQADGESMTLRECTLDPRQLDWSPGMFPNFVTGLIEGLTNWEIPDWISYYGSLSFGDVEGDGDDDVCVRRGDGVYCAFADGAGFSSFARVLDDFRDDLGWFAAPYGATVQLGDIDGDGADELCGRGPNGVYCSDWNDATISFDPPELRSADFSDLQGYGADASRYRSLRIVDLDGDGLGDLCARSELGIQCARSAGRTFWPAQSWTSEQFTDAQGWNKEEYGSTLRFGDVDGDGDPDVCGRTKEGILCARNNSAGSFIDPHLWSHTGDFGDGNGWNKQLSYYGSIRLADIDRDGDYDVCGRGPGGLLCSLSTSTAFTIATSLGSADAFSDKSGWQLDRYGSTLGLLDLNLDGFADLCAWGPGYDGKVGLNCSLAD
ncbi:MAG TPA: ricin-type beta-trefoil lectin domain protein [Polyangiales bacterium]|nr:ricin-type beta-trefoil lectin domain protein [Polyangiales bacterium]